MESVSELKTNSPMECQYPITKNSDKKDCKNQAAYYDNWGWVYCEKHAKKDGKLRENVTEIRQPKLDDNE